MGLLAQPFMVILKPTRNKLKNFMWRKEGNNCFRVLPLFVHNYCTVTIDPAPWQETAFAVACCKIAQKGEFNSENSPYFRNNINKALLKLKSGLALSIYAEHVF